MSKTIGNALDDLLSELKRAGRVGVMAHLVAGYPSEQESKDLAKALAENGADILEIQIPFSDPTADGPVITAACQKALQTGTKPRFALELAAQVVKATARPVLIMSYLNILFRWPGGVERFLREAAAAGVCGTIVPDIPPEEDHEGYFTLCPRSGVHPIIVVSPNVPRERLAVLKSAASGMVYTTSRVGTTGAASDVADPTLRGFLQTLHQEIGLPVAVGFGIRDRRQIEALSGLAEVAVVGTYLLETFQNAGVKGAASALRALCTG